MSFNRSAIITRQLADAERDLAYATLWLSQCEDPRYPLAAENREHFLDLRSSANDRYARALRLNAKLKPQQQATAAAAQIEMLL